MFKNIFSGLRKPDEAYFARRKESRRSDALPRWSPHRSETTDRIQRAPVIQSPGFDNVSIGQIMAGAGLTHGGFYSYFKSKSKLYAEVLVCFFTDPEWKSCWEGVEVDLSSSEVGLQVIRAYLSRQHFEDVENSCPMVALPTDVSRSDESAKRAFETVFTAMVSVLERGAVENGQPRHITAQATAALCVGGMVVARAMVSRVAADELREACASVALKLGGWRNENKSRSKASKRPRQGNVKPLTRSKR